MKTYTIPKGRRRSGLFFSPLKRAREYRITFRLHEDCAYDPDYGNGQINKIGGVGFGLPWVYRVNREVPWWKREAWYVGFGNSIRVGWRQLSEKPDSYAVFSYTRVSGKMCDPEMWPFPNWHGDKDSIDIIPANKYLLAWRMFPYFGGRKPAPHTMHVDVKVEAVE